MSLTTQKTIYKHMWSKEREKSELVWMVQWMNALDLTCLEKPNETDRRWYTKRKAPGRLVYYWAVSRILFEVGPRKGRAWKYIQREGPLGKLKKKQGPREACSREQFQKQYAWAWLWYISKPEEKIISPLQTCPSLALRSVLRHFIRLVNSPPHKKFVLLLLKLMSKI